MSANNDFFVKFGSNAGTWARGLEKELGPANRAIAHTEAMLDRLERKSTGVSNNLRRALAQDLDQRGSSRNPPPAGSSPRLPTHLTDNLEKASAQIYAMTESLELTVRALKGLPDLVKRAMNQGNGYINNGGEGHRPDSLIGRAGRYTTSDDPMAVSAMLSTALNRSLKSTAPTTPVSIAGVGTSAVLESGMKRIVDAIDAQTKTLAGALGNIKVETVRGNAAAARDEDAATTAAAPAKKSATKPVAQAAADLSDDKAVEQMVAQMRKGLEDARTVGAQLQQAADQQLRTLAEKHGVESKIYQDQKRELDAALAQQRGVVAKMERNVEGVTRAEQTAERRAVAEKARKESAELPVISNKEVERRQREMALIRSTQDPTFLSNVGRKRTDYGKADVSEMARALKDQGFDPGIKWDDRLDTMALKVAEAGERFGRVFQDSVPDNLRTTGFNTYRETELPNTLRSFLSQANDEVIQAYARQRDADRQILSRSFSGGDTDDLHRGRRQFGSGLLPDADGQKLLEQAFPSIFEGLQKIGDKTYTRSTTTEGRFTEQEVREAEERLKANASLERDTALNLMRQGPGFDPYDPRVTAGIKAGSTPEEQQAAADARLFVRHLREATTEIDAYSKAHIKTTRAIDLLEWGVKELKDELRANDLLDKDDPNRLSKTQVGNRVTAINDMEEQLAHQRGLRRELRNAATRMGFADRLDDPNLERDLAMRDRSRRGYEERVQRAQGAPTLSDFSALRGGLGEALRQYMGSDFRYNRSSGRIGNANGLSSENSRELNKAFVHYISQLRQAAEAARQGVSGDERQRIDSRFENATVGLLGQLEKNFNGLAPKFEQLASLGLDAMGYPSSGANVSAIRRIQDPDNLAGEERREERRQQIEADRRNRTAADLSPAQKLLRAEEAYTRATAKAAEAREKAAAASEKVAIKEAEAQGRMANLTPEKRQAAIDAADRAAELRTRLSQLGTGDRESGMPTNTGNIVYYEDPAARLTASGGSENASKVVAQNEEYLARETENLANLRRREAAQRAALTRALAKGDPSKVEQAQEKLARVQNELADKTAQVSMITAKLPDWNKAAEDAAAARQATYDRTEKPLHEPGERLRAAPPELYRELFDLQQKISDNDVRAPLTQQGMQARVGDLRAEIGTYPDLQEERKRVQDELARAEIEARPYKGVREAIEEERQATSELKHFETEAEKAAERVRKLGNAAAKAADQTEVAAKEPVPTDRASLRAERKTLTDAGPWTKKDMEGLTDEGELAAATARRDRVKEIDAALRASKTKEERDLEQERRDLRAAGPYQQKQIKDLTDKEEIAAAQARRKRIGEITTRLKELDGATAKTVETAVQTAKAVSSDAAVVKRAKAQSTDPEAEALRAERAELRKQGPYTRADVKRTTTAAQEAEAALQGRRGGALMGAITRAQNKNDEQALEAARNNLRAKMDEADAARAIANATSARAARIRVINARLEQLDKAAGGAAGGGNPPTPPTSRGGGRSGGPDDNNILRQILGAINAMHTTLKGGIRVTGAVKGTATAATTTPKTPKAPAEPKPPKQPGLNSRMTPEEVQRRQAGLAKAREVEDATRAFNTAEKQEKLERRITANRSKGAEALREQTRAAAQVDAILENVGDTTRAEILKLNQMTAALDKAADQAERLALQERIARQQVAVYTGIDRDLQNKNISGTDRRYAAQAVLSAAGPEVSGTELSSIARTSRARNPQMLNRTMDRQLASGVPSADQSEWMEQWGNGLFGNKGFWGRIVGSTGAFIVRNFAAGAVFGLTNALQTVLDQALQTEMTFVRVSQALEATNKPLGSLRGDLQNISTDYGVALNDVYTSAASMTGLFSNTADLAVGTRVSTQLQVISNGALNATEAVGVLASTYTAFRNNAESNLGGTQGLERIADTLTLIQNELGVNVETTAEGVSRLAGAAESMGLSFQETAVYSAQIAKLTNQTGAAAGEQFSRIMASTVTGRGKTALNDAFAGLIDDKTGRDLGVAMANSLSVGDQGAVLENMMMGWDQLTESQRQNLSVTLFGQRQMAAGQALFADTENTLSLLTKAYHANGDAEDRMQALMGTLNKQIDVLMTNFQNFALALVESGILNFFQTVLGLVNVTLKEVNDFFSMVNKAAESNSMVAMLRDLTTWAIGAAVAFKVLGASVGGLRGALRNMRAENLPQENTGVPRANAPLGDARARGTVPYGPVTRREAIAERVERPGFRSYGPTGIARMGIDRVVRVPMERFGRIIERGGMRWEQSNNRYVQMLGRATQRDGQLIRNISLNMQEGLQSGWDASRMPGANFLDRRASSLDSYADRRRERAAELQTRFNDQRQLDLQRRLGPVGDPQGLMRQWQAGGMSLFDQAKRQTVDPSLERQARVQNMLAGAAKGTSTVLSGTSSALKAVASSGLALDAALVGVGLAIAAVVSYRAQIKDLEGSAERAAEAYKPEKPVEDADPEDWMGEASQKMRDQIKDWNKNGASMGEEWGYFFSKKGVADDIRDLGHVLPWNLDQETTSSERGVAEDLIGLSADKYKGGASGFLKELQDAESPLADINMDDYRLEGLEETGALYSEYMDRIGQAASGQLGYIPDALSDANAEFQSELESMSADVLSDPNLKEGQKNAWLAFIEMLDGIITQEIKDRSAVATGLASGMNSDQLASLQTALATARAARGSKGGFDFGGVTSEQFDAIGAEPGSKMESRLERLERGGMSTAESLKLELKVLQEAAKAARANWLVELEAGGRDSAEFEAADSTLNAILGQLDEVASNSVETIISEAEGLAAAADAAGQYAKAARIRLAAMKEAEAFGRAAEGGDDPAAGVRSTAEQTPRGFSRGADPQENAKGKKNRATADPALVASFEAVYQQAVFLATKDITMQIARTSDAAKRAALELLKSQIEAGLAAAISGGNPIAGAFDAIPDRGAANNALTALAPVEDLLNAGSKNYGDAVVSQQDVHAAQVGVADAQTSYADAQAAAAEEAKSGAGDAAAKAAEARQNAAALKQARLGVAQAAADARGDAVASAKIQVAMAKAQIGAAKAELAAAKTASESAQARIAILNAQAQLIGAVAAVQAAQQDLVQSQYDVTIAMAEAAGKTVLAAERSLGAARAALAAARKKSKGKATAEVNAARVSLIQAQAAARDAQLQDQLDTIDFNMEMGKMTQSSAISALQEILRTSDLTKAQRRQLLLQIKGMKDEMADSQWNFGDIKLPTPYQMRRYIQERRDQFAGELENAAQGGRGGRGKKPPRRDELMGLGAASGNEVKYGGGGNTTTTIYINGADVNKVRKIVTDVVGGRVNTRTTGSRRSNR